MNPTVGHDQDYEWRIMNWYGPNQEAMYRDLKNHILRGLFPVPGTAWILHESIRSAHKQRGRVPCPDHMWFRYALWEVA